MPYSKTTWKNKQSPPINDSNLNKIEQGLEDALSTIAFHIQDGNNPHGVDAGQVNADLASIEATRLAVEQDAVQVSSDRIIVEGIGTQVAGDVLQTQADAAQTLIDRGLTAADVIQTNADVMQTGIDRQAVADDRAAVFALKGNVDDVLTQVTEDRVVTLAAKELAEKWATEEEDQEITEGKYSAYHWAQKAEESAEATLAGAANAGNNTNITSLSALEGEIKTPTVISFDTTSELTTLAGQLTWNQDDGTLDLGMNGGHVVQHIGLETLVHVRADSNIANGQVVMVTGAIGNSGRLTGAPATGLTLVTMKNILGVATEDIAADSWGFVTSFGQVREFDTSIWAEGDSLYYDPTVAGGLTNVMPASPNPKVCLGYVVNSHASVGSIHVDIRIAPSLASLPDVELTSIATEEAITWNNVTHRWENSLAELETGFNTPQTIVEVYDPVARTVTLSGTGILYHRGKKILDVTDGHVSAPHPDINGVWFYLYRTDGGFQWSAAPWQLGEDAMIVYVNYGVIDKFAIRECHGLMDWESHREFHEQIGTYRRSGGGVTVITGSAVTEDKQPTIAQTTLADEDLPTALPALGKGQYTHFYLSGNGNVSFSKNNPHIVPISGDGRVQYNQDNGGVWELTTINVVNNFHVVWLVGMPTTTDSVSQDYRYVFFQGQKLYTTLAAAQDATFDGLNTGTFASLAPEWTVLEKFIVRTSNTNNGWSVESSERIVTSRSQALIGSAGFTSHTLLSDRESLDQHPVQAISGLSGNGLEILNDELVLGTPSSINSSTTNSVTETSHTHAITSISGGTF